MEVQGGGDWRWWCISSSDGEQINKEGKCIALSPRVPDLSLVIGEEERAAFEVFRHKRLK